jgi:hypothetical protein
LRAAAPTGSGSRPLSEALDRTDMTTNRLIAIITASFCSQWLVAADAPSKDSSKVFEISVVVTDRGNAVFDNWDKPTGKAFDVSPIKLAPRGKFLSALLMFKGCAPDKSGNCNADVDIIAYDPKGNVYGKMLGVELWQQKPAPDAGFTQLSRSYMGLVIEPKDPIGTYRVMAVARDRVGKIEARAETQFQVGM